MWCSAWCGGLPPNTQSTFPLTCSFILRWVLAEAFWPPHNPALKQNDAFWSLQLYPKLLLPLWVSVSLPLSLPLCSVLCVYRLAVCVPANWQTLLWSSPSPGGSTPLALLSSCLCIDTHSHIHTTFTYTHSCAHHRGRARWCEIDRERKRERAKSLMCSTFSVFMFQTAAILTHQNVKGEAQKRLDDSWLTLQTWPILIGADEKKHRGGLVVSFPLDFETRPLLAPPTDRHSVPGS